MSVDIPNRKCFCIRRDIVRIPLHLAMLSQQIVSCSLDQCSTSCVYLPVASSPRNVPPKMDMKYPTFIVMMAIILSHVLAICPSRIASLNIQKITDTNHNHDVQCPWQIHAEPPWRYGPHVAPCDHVDSLGGGVITILALGLFGRGQLPPPNRDVSPIEFLVPPVMLQNVLAHNQEPEEGSQNDQEDARASIRVFTSRRPRHGEQWGGYRGKEDHIHH